MPEIIDRSRIEIGTVLYHRLDDIEATVIGFDEEHIHVRYNKKWYDQTETKYRYQDIGVQLFFTKEEAKSDVYENNLTKSARARIEAEENKRENAKKRKRQEAEERAIREAQAKAWEEEQAKREQERLKREEETYQRNQKGWKELYELLLSLECRKPARPFEGLCHYTDLANLESILKEGKVYSRIVAKDKGLLTTDAADIGVLDHTGSRVKSYVRMYYYPNTPTIYRMQGVHSFEADKIPHMPAPVLLVFDPVIMSHKGVRFYEGNAASSFSYSTIDCYMAKDSFNWDQIQERGGYPPDEGIIKRNYRNAEFHYPDEISTEYIKKIVFRSEAEYLNACFLFGKNQLFSCNPYMFPNCDPFYQKDDYKYYINYLKYYSFDVSNGENESIIHLELLFENNNLEGYDKRLVLKSPTEIIYEKIEKKTIEEAVYRWGSDRHATLTYDFSIDNKYMECIEQLELEYYLNDHRVLYNGEEKENQF
ncbi:MAG: DUF4433 domain-containing protein [Firmicutes bacterium]|nr:DUF4433 domain-containing protein [Bacillota bacterium]